MKRLLFRASLIIFFGGLSLTSHIYAQERKELRLNGIVKIGGWEIPGLKGSLKIKRSQYMKVGEADNIPIFLTLLKPKGGSVIAEYDSHYSFDDGATLTFVPSALRTYIINRYDVDGKVFCYSYQGGGVHAYVAKNGQKKFYTVGCLTGIAYYDEDGDGVFERLEVIGSVGFTPRVPEWVTGTAKKDIARRLSANEK